MRKLWLMLLIAVVIGVNVNAQNVYDVWYTENVVDAFDDPTGEVVKMYLTEDAKFSNSATYNSNLTVKFVDWGNRISISLYEYNRGPEASLVYKLTRGTLVVKRGDGTKQTYDITAYKEGGLSISAEYQKKGFILMADLIRNNNGETLSFYIREKDFDSSGKSTYLFKIKSQE